MSLKTVLKGVANMAGLDVVRQIDTTRYRILASQVHLDRTSIYERLLLSCLNRFDSINVAIVGANDGKINDPFYRVLEKNSRLIERTNVLLIEPQASLLPMIKENYNFHANHRIENCAVGSFGELRLFSVKEAYWKDAQPAYAKGWPLYRAPTGITSSNRDHVLAWLRRYSPSIENAEDAILETIVPAHPLVDILKRVSMPDRLHVLQIDAEGNDDVVVYASNLHVTQPAIIHFEDKGEPGDRRSKLSEHLKNNGYIELSAEADTIAVRVG